MKLSPTRKSLLLFTLPALLLLPSCEVYPLGYAGGYVPSPAPYYRPCPAPYYRPTYGCDYSPRPWDGYHGGGYHGGGYGGYCH